MKTQSGVAFGITLALLSTLNSQLSTAQAQGSLTPPGAPAPTMKTLDQLDAKLEKRVPISSVPFSINSPGSYYFTSNVTGVGAISINADNVTVDLNGFTLEGGPGSATGFFVGSVHSNLCIRNGCIADRGGLGVGALNAVNSRLADLRIINNGSGGLEIGAGSEISQCLVRSNFNSGIHVDVGCIIRECTCVGNTVAGITTGNDCVIRDCVTTGNGSLGINCFSGTLIENCTSSGNGASGFSTGSYSVVRNCSARANGNYGIFAVLSCRLEHCQATGNTSTGIYCAGDEDDVFDCVATGNGDRGIHVRGGSRVSDCLAANNTSSGIYVFLPGCQVRGNTCKDNNTAALTTEAGIFIDDSDNRVEDNHVTGVNFGIKVAVTYVRNVVVRNTVAGSGINNYVDPGGNDFGPIGVANAATSPWANITH